MRSMKCIECIERIGQTALGTRNHCITLSPNLEAREKNFERRNLLKKKFHDRANQIKNFFKRL